MTHPRSRVSSTRQSRMSVEPGFKEAVREAVEEIQGMKRDSGRVPAFAFRHEVLNLLRPEWPGVSSEDALRALRELYREKRIEHHMTVNDLPMFGVTNQPTIPRQDDNRT